MANPKRGIQITEWNGQTMFDLHRRFVEIWDSLEGSSAILTPATTITNETTWGITPAVGTLTSYAREDHTHGTPTSPVTAPGGSDTYVQFNDGGAFGGDEHFIWNKTSDYLQVGASGYLSRLQRGTITAIGNGTTNGSLVLYSESGSGTVGSYIACKTSAGVNVFTVGASGKIKIYAGSALPDLYDFEMNSYAFIGTGVISSALIARLDDSTGLQIRRANKTTPVINFDLSAAAAQIDVLDTTNISFGTGTGTKLGTAANQKIGFWGATPVVQDTGWAVTAGYTADRAFNPESTTLTEVARTLGTLIDTLKTYGHLGA